MRRSPRKTVWCNPGHWPVYIGFVPSRQAWAEAMRDMGQSEPWPGDRQGAGRVTTFDTAGRCFALVTLGEAAREFLTDMQVSEVLVHETQHILQFIHRTVGEAPSTDEGGPGAESDAYCAQRIWRDLRSAYDDTLGRRRGHDRGRGRKRRRERQQLRID